MRLSARAPTAERYTEPLRLQNNLLGDDCATLLARLNQLRCSVGQRFRAASNELLEWLSSIPSFDWYKRSRENIIPIRRINLRKVIIRGSVAYRVVVGGCQHAYVGNNVCLVKSNAFRRKVRLRINVMELPRVVRGQCRTQVYSGSTYEALWLLLSK